MNNKIILIFIGLTFLASCADSKQFQCQKIYQIANEVAQETKSLTKGQGTEIDQKSWLLAADKIEQAAENMKKLAVKYPELEKYKTAFAQVYKDYATATREIIQVIETRNKNGAKLAQEKVRKAGQLEQETGEAFNTYCQAQ
ncbi:MAG: hypothetical protein ACK552_26460 [Microcystis sp.]|jgi:vacuolar-type H+-ATPase subunit I/STV1|nr:hypothetical protein [Microcystis aeruginosa SX13-01]NCR70212.1 hypothetical protein [Microcystis aeruginosa LG13-12]